MWGAQSFLDSIDKGDKNLFAKILTSPLPNVGGMLRFAKGDYTVTEKSSLADYVNYKLGLSEMGIAPKLKPVIDLEGENKQSGYRRFAWQTSKVDKKLLKYIVDHNIALGEPGKPKVGNRIATDEEYRKYKILAGKYLAIKLHDNANRIMKLPLNRAEDLVDGLARVSRAKAKAKLGY
jgi:hypothetical protein